jgi:hypothetical protein
VKHFFDENIADGCLGVILSSHATFRADDVCRKGCGGGVLVCVPKIFTTVLNSSFSNDFFELLDLTIFCSQVQLVVVYRSPTPNKTNSIKSLMHYFEHVTNWQQDIPIVLLGDFNMPKVDWSGVPPTPGIDYQFFALMLELGFSQYVTESTHDKGGILDLVFCTRDEFMQFCRVVDK